tara:strand:- start:180 stop:920 length:741 start_codon:yes stop_codon:yes gene_type:complete
MICDWIVIENDIKEITKDYTNFLYDFSITTLKEESKSQRYRDHTQENSFDNRIISLISKANSVLVLRIFSHVAADYFFQKEILPRIVSHLNKKYNQDQIWFDYDDYILDRKEYAMRSGAGRLTKPSLVFDKRFGLNCKFDLIFTNLKFKKYTVVEEDNPVYKNCIGCPAPCESSCPVGCRMNFKLIDWEKCSNFVDDVDLFRHPDKMCRICQDSCPYSDELKNDILMDYPDCGGYMKPIEYYENLY